MDVRCGQCDKLFRISDDKITGLGVKFACTRCNGPVKITKEEFENYTLSKAAVSTLDMFEPVRKTAKTPLPETGEAKVAAPAVADKQDFDLSASSEHEVFQDEQAPVFSEPAPFIDQPISEEPRQEPVFQDEVKLEPKAQPAPPKEELRTSIEPKIETPPPTKKVEPRPKPVAAPTPPKKEPVRPASSAEKETVKVFTPAAPSRSGQMTLILVAALIIIGIGGYMLLRSMGADIQKSETVIVQEIPSIEGLRIYNIAGAMEASGDLLITGMVENSLDKARTTWNVIADIYDAKGVVLAKVGLLNGRQHYTQRDYDILAKRGVNVQELKAKRVQEKGVVIPPKGSVPFEIRCLQPPVGIANLNAVLQPYNPERMYKELSQDIK